MQEQEKESVVVLHNLRSVHNVGSIFRTSEALGIDHMYLVGTTPTPSDRFGRKRKDMQKTALGAEDLVPWTYREKIDDLILKLRKEDFLLIAVEQAAQSIDYRDITCKRKTAFIFGNEPDGLSNDVLTKCDEVAEIPMNGKKESLNVSVAFGVALYRFLGH